MSWKDIPEWAKASTKSILEIVKAKDPYTFFHCCRVGMSSRLLGKACGLNEYQQIVLEYSGLLHDVGKVGIPDSVLFKPAKLTEAEAYMMKMHPIKSLQVIKPLMIVDFFKDVALGVELHHERPDGRGYPYGYSAKDISELVRMVSLVDAFDAMTTTRPYRKAMAAEKAIQEVKQHAGTQFDENVVKVFVDSQRFMQKEIKNIKVEEHIAYSLMKAS